MVRFVRSIPVDRRCRFSKGLRDFQALESRRRPAQTHQSVAKLWKMTNFLTTAVASGFLILRVCNPLRSIVFCISIARPALLGITSTRGLNLLPVAGSFPWFAERVHDKAAFD